MLGGCLAANGAQLRRRKGTRSMTVGRTREYSCLLGELCLQNQTSGLGTNRDSELTVGVSGCRVSGVHAVSKNAAQARLQCRRR